MAKPAKYGSPLHKKRISRALKKHHRIRKHNMGLYKLATRGMLSTDSYFKGKR